MNLLKPLISLFAFTFVVNVSADELNMRITKKYLNIPVSHKAERRKMLFDVDDKTIDRFVIRLTNDNPDYWVFYDVSALKGKKLNITFDGSGLNNIVQSDSIFGESMMYKEKYRPQFHFTTQRGWINDPNGLVYLDGEYHLYYQHNPFEREWENMHWGHAVSKDLIHWNEIEEALCPDDLGTMFSGSAVIDYENNAGFNKNGKPAMVVFYTADSPSKEVQCMAYSLDNGRSFTKYDKNPIIDSKEKWNSKDTRDPKVFWYAPKKHWVLVLNERDGHSIYNSIDLKDWTYKSHVTGFWECPELFELAVDGDDKNKKWVMYGASGTYMVGDFDGEKFTPQEGKYYYNTGSIYAAQTYSNIPQSDGRRIQIGWGRISHKDMPFNGMMLLPTELSLNKTKNGVRLVSNPVKEVESVCEKKGEWKNLNSDKASDNLNVLKDDDGMRIKVKIKLSHATDAGIKLNDQRIFLYDMNSNTINGVFYSPEDPTSMTIYADIFIDRTSVEVFVDNGAYSYSMQRDAKDDIKENKFSFFGNNINVELLEAYKVNSIWK
ncbi:MAG: DUF4980 domain-containing protein [Bacteroidales bacterium]|nr:DUF4980 domain-containing protein [Bacteroidales bacterium]